MRRSAGKDHAVNDCYFSDPESMAKFCAQLTREGIRFETRELETASATDRYLVRIHGNQ